MKYIIYCRKSTDTEDKQVLSLEAQEKEMAKIVETNGLEVISILTESKSAKEPGRPVFNDMMKLFESGKADGILCWKIDRLTRNPVDGGKIQWLLQNGKIQCIKTFEKSYYPNDNVLLMSIEQAMANQYIRDLSVNVKRGNRAKLERGEWPNLPPLGYVNDKANKTIVLDPERAKYIPRAFELYLTGSHGFKSISNILHDEGLRTRSGTKLVLSHVQKILSSIFYTGIMERDGKYYQGKHQPLISKETYDSAQDVMHGRAHPRPQRLFFPLRGFLTCDNCGCALTASLKKGHHYYYCTNGKKKCDEHKTYLREKYLYTLVGDIFTKIDFTEQKIELMYEAAQEQTGTDMAYIEQILATLQTQLQSLATKESRLLDTFLAQQISKELYDQKNLEIQNERVSISKKIKDLESRQPSSTLEPTKKLFLEASRATKDFLDGDDAKKRKIVENLLWNLSMKNKTVAQVRLKSPFDIMAKVPKNASFENLRAIEESNLGQRFWRP